jgi:hypothetical protein
MKHPKVLLCYNLTKKIIDKKKEIFFIVELNLFTIGTITLLEPKKINATIFGEKIGTKDLTFNFPHFKGQIQLDTTPTHIKVQDLDIVCWMLLEDHQVRLLNLGIIDTLR